MRRIASTTTGMTRSRAPPAANTPTARLLRGPASRIIATAPGWKTADPRPPSASMATSAHTVGATAMKLISTELSSRPRAAARLRPQRSVSAPMKACSTLADSDDQGDQAGERDLAQAEALLQGGEVHRQDVAEGVVGEVGEGDEAGQRHADQRGAGSKRDGHRVEATPTGPGHARARASVGHPGGDGSCSALLNAMRRAAPRTPPASPARPRWRGPGRAMTRRPGSG
jgi:hypothetical protein